MERFFRWSLTFLLLLATAMECGQIVLRHIFHMPVMWIDETIIFPAIWLYMLGCANASRENSQITAKILPLLFPAPRPTAIFALSANLFAMLVSFWLTWHAVDYFFYSLGANRKTGYLFLPLYIGESAIATGMLLISAYSIRHFLQSCARVRAVFGKGKQ